MDTIFSESLLNKFNSLTIPNKITIAEKLGEWRSDFRGIAIKNNTLNVLNKEELLNTDILIDSNEKISYPRHYLWQEVKYAVKSLDAKIDKNDIEKVLNNLNNRVWLPGLKGFLFRLYWNALRDECRLLASLGYIFKDRKQLLIEDFFDNYDRMYIPSPETWPWKQWDNGFYAWNWL